MYGIFLFTRRGQHYMVLANGVLIWFDPDIDDEWRHVEPGELCDPVTK